MTRRSAGARPRVLSRVLAKMVDILIIVGMAAVLPYPIGPLAGFVYSLVADGFTLKRGPLKLDGQSLGKKFFGLKVIVLAVRNVAEPGSGGIAEEERQVKVRRPATMRSSILRNTPVGVATFFAIIPVWGWLILGIVGLPLMVMEVYLMATVQTGHRLGDVMGDTEVVNA